MSIEKDFNGKVVLITGSSSGIGAVTAQEFSRAGAQVVITGRNGNNLSEVGNQCLKVSPKRLKPLEVVADVSKDVDCKRLVDKTIETFGKLDILVNNAGKCVTNSIEDQNILDTFEDIINTNLRSVVYLTHLFAKHLEKTKGNIINISSVAVFKPAHNIGIYCMSKTALDMFTRCLALELGPKGIRVNVVNPAHVATGIFRSLGLDKNRFERYLERIKGDYPIGRYGLSIDIANVILFLASEDCSWVTGINFLSDGGYSYGQMKS